MNDAPTGPAPKDHNQPPDPLLAERLAPGLARFRHAAGMLRSIEGEV